jgi:hypothetical protein
MKINNAPHTSERPALTQTATQNTGIVPQKNPGIVPQKNPGIVPQKRPGDGFEASAKVNTGITGGVKPGGAMANVNTDFKLSANLEPFRKTFDFAGRRISHLSTPELQQSAIERMSNKLFKKLGGLATQDEINAGLNASTAARMAYHPQEINDPQYGAYKCDFMLQTSAKLSGLANTLKDIGLPIARDPSIQGSKDILSAAKPQLDSLGLKGRDKHIAKNYLFALVNEERARLGTPATNGNTGITGTGQLTLPQTVRP